ncbi:MAG: M20 family metallopeptidase [Bacillota bacterium]
MNIEEYINHAAVIDLLSELIQIHSPYFHEDKIMNYVHGWLRKNEIPVSFHHYTEDKITKYQGTNVIGSLIGSKPGKRILLNGHLDTVTICEGWTKDPLKATIEGDRLYGLGALDMKSGCAAIMLALHAFVKTTSSFEGEILYTFVSDEEGPYGLGTDALITDAIIQNVDAAIVTEPSSGFSSVPFPCLCLGARGGYNYTVTLKGKSSHAANPEKGINAVVEASKIMMALHQMDMKEDDKLGFGSVCIIGAEGGGAACSVPDKASFTVFRHTVRGEDKAYLVQEIEKAVRLANIKGDYQLSFRDAPHLDCQGFEPYTVPEDHPFTVMLQESISRITGTPAAVRYFSSIGDFNYLGTRAGIPTFVFGPYGENYHAPDEYVEIHSVAATAKVIYDFLVKALHAKNSFTILAAEEGRSL